MKSTLVVLTVALFASVGWAEETRLQAAVRLTGEGKFVSALAAGRESSDELEATQAELYVLHQAGALELALEAGLRGLSVAPQDPWLLDRCTYLAISLGVGELAIALAQRLQEALPAAEWSRAAWMLEEAEALKIQREAESASLVRARAVTLSLLLVAGLAAAIGARRSPRKRPAIVQ